MKAITFLSTAIFILLGTTAFTQESSQEAKKEENLSMRRLNFLLENEEVMESCYCLHGKDYCDGEIDTITQISEKADQWELKEDSIYVDEKTGYVPITLIVNFHELEASSRLLTFYMDHWLVKYYGHCEDSVEIATLDVELSDLEEIDVILEDDVTIERVKDLQKSVILKPQSVDVSNAKSTIVGLSVFNLLGQEIPVVNRGGEIFSFEELHGFFIFVFRFGDGNTVPVKYCLQ